MNRKRREPATAAGNTFRQSNRWKKASSGRCRTLPYRSSCLALRSSKAPVSAMYHAVGWRRSFFSGHSCCHGSCSFAATAGSQPTPDRPHRHSGHDRSERHLLRNDRLRRHSHGDMGRKPLVFGRFHWIRRGRITPSKHFIRIHDMRNNKIQDAGKAHEASKTCVRSLSCVHVRL